MDSTGIGLNVSNAEPTTCLDALLQTVLTKPDISIRIPREVFLYFVLCFLRLILSSIFVSLLVSFSL